jgi:hypothetical protein
MFHVKRAQRRFAVLADICSELMSIIAVLATQLADLHLNAKNECADGVVHGDVMHERRPEADAASSCAT